MRKLASLCLAVLLGGCTPSVFSDRPATLHYIVAPAISASETEITLLARYHAADASQRDQMSREDYRNSAIWLEIGADNENFSQFTHDLRQQRAGFNLASDGAVITLNGIAAVTGGSATKAALAAISAGIVGLRGAADKELFNAEALSAIIAHMKAARLKVLATITVGMKKSIGDYSLEQALVDLRAYADAGTLVGSIEGITEEAGSTASQALEDIRKNTVTRSTVYRDSLAARNDIATRIGKLADAKAITMAFLMQRYFTERTQAVQNDLAEEDPSGSRFKTGSDAKTFLIYWIDQEEGNPDQLKEWAETLDALEKQ